MLLRVNPPPPGTQQSYRSGETSSDPVDPAPGGDTRPSPAPRRNLTPRPPPDLETAVIADGSSDLGRAKTRALGCKAYYGVIGGPLLEHILRPVTIRTCVVRTIVRECGSKGALEWSGSPCNSTRRSSVRSRQNNHRIPMSDRQRVEPWYAPCRIGVTQNRSVPSNLNVYEYPSHDRSYGRHVRPVCPNRTGIGGNRGHDARLYHCPRHEWGKLLVQ